MALNGRLTELLQALHSHDDQAHDDAYVALVALGRKAVPGLVEAFDETAGRARLSVIRVFGEIGDARAVALLIELVRSRDSREYMFVSSLAAKALGQIAVQEGPSGEQAVAGLLEMLVDENIGVRRMSALVLGNLAEAEAVPALTVALGDLDRQVRGLAARALGRVGTDGGGADRAVPALIVRLADHDHLTKPLGLADDYEARTVSEAAAWALGQIATPEATRALQNWRGAR